MPKQIRRRVIVTGADVIQNVLFFLNSKKHTLAKKGECSLAPDAEYKPALDPDGNVGFVLGPCLEKGHVEEMGLFMGCDDAFLLWIDYLIENMLD